MYFRHIVSSEKLARLSTEESSIVAVELPMKTTTNDNNDKDNEIIQLKQEHKRQKEVNSQLNNQLKIECFGLTRFSNDDNLITFYTGFASYLMFMTSNPLP